MLVRSTILGDPGAVSRAGRKDATKVFKHGWKSPWVPTLTPELENFRRAFSPGPNDCPRVSEDEEVVELHLKLHYLEVYTSCWKNCEVYRRRF